MAEQDPFEKKLRSYQVNVDGDELETVVLQGLKPAPSSRRGGWIGLALACAAAALIGFTVWPREKSGVSDSAQGDANAIGETFLFVGAEKLDTDRPEVLLRDMSSFEIVRRVPGETLHGDTIREIRADGLVVSKNGGADAFRSREDLKNAFNASVSIELRGYAGPLTDKQRLRVERLALFGADSAVALLESSPGGAAQTLRDVRRLKQRADIGDTQSRFAAIDALDRLRDPLAEQALQAIACESADTNVSLRAVEALGRRDSDAARASLRAVQAGALSESARAAAAAFLNPPATREKGGTHEAE